MEKKVKRSWQYRGKIDHEVKFKDSWALLVKTKDHGSFALFYHTQDPDYFMQLDYGDTIYFNCPEGRKEITEFARFRDK